MPFLLCAEKVTGLEGDRAETKVAEACERMLTDSKAVQKLAELQKKDAGLFNQIKRFITNFFNKIVERYKKT